MKLIHIADLHIGSVDADVLAAAGDAIAKASADMLLVSGDLTQRGKKSEFKEARDWVDQRNLPTVTVPGNHDTPLLNMAARVTGAFDRYEAYFGDLSRSLTISGIKVDGLNTARGWQARTNWAEGSVDLEDLRALEASDSEIAHVRILACHHPFISPTGAPLRTRTRRGRRASEWLAGSAFDLLMTGHVHTPHTECIAEDKGSYLAITAGTLSTRLRQAPPSFNILTFETDTLTISTLSLQSAQFLESGATTWQLKDLERIQH